jgi:cytoskeleton protein RodZ
MAPRVGQALREARTKRGIALNDVERATKVRVQYLRALEEERWDRLPDPARGREFLSVYANYLGLDDEALIEGYESSRERAGRAGPIPAGVLRPVRISRDRSSRRLIVVAASVAAVLLLGVALVAALGSSGGDDEGAEPAPALQKPRGQTSTSTTAEAPVSSGEASVELSATADVWVCMVGADGSQPVDGETLTAGETRGPFTSPRFEMTFGNGSLEMTVNGDPVKVPALAEPLGFRVTPDGAKRLAPGAQPSCA